MGRPLKATLIVLRPKLVYSVLHMSIIYIIVVGIVSIFACMVVAAVISDPTIITQFIMVLWNLFGNTDSPFFWMLTAPAIVMFAIFFLYWLFLHLTTAPKNGSP